MRSALVVVLVGLLLAPAAWGLTGPAASATDKVQEAMRLERRALEAFHQDQADPEVDELVRRSKELLREVAGIDELSERVRGDVGAAFRHDDRFLKEKAGDAVQASNRLLTALVAKQGAIGQIEDDTWTANASKKARATTVSTPKCRSTAAVGAPGCWGVDSWDIYIAPDARRAKCTFSGPRGEITAARPLFPGAAEEMTCTLTNRTHTVGGVRKRVVRAELRITVLPGSAVAGSKPVRVAAHWR